MSKTALFYSPAGGSVDKVSHMLGEMIGTDKVDIIHVKNAVEDDLVRYKKMILLGSTVGADHWDNEVIVDEWVDFFATMEDISLEDKKIAIVGLGNSVLYPSHFADGMAVLYDKIKQKNAKVFGKVNSAAYDFEDSEALDDDGYFCGLAIDEDNEPELTQGRLEKWIRLLQPDFEF